MTSHRKRVVWVGGALLVLIALPAMAQDGFPGGSWRQTCHNITGDPITITVHALCRTQLGDDINTSIDLRTACSPHFTTGLANRNGVLTCEGPVPAGSYLQSCRDAYVMNNKLTANCEDKQGHWHSSTMPLAGCSVGPEPRYWLLLRGPFRMIENSDGRLLCDQ
jgi:hypothetical protein